MMRRINASPAVRFIVLRHALAAVLLCLAAGCGSELTEAPPSIPSDEEILAQVDAALDATEARYMSADQQAAWQVVHGILAFGRNLHVYADGELVPALDWLLAGGDLNGWDLRPGDHGLIAVQAPGSKSGQGHPDQWLGYLSQCALPNDQPIVVHGQTFTVQDLVTQAQWEIYEGKEASWTLMGLTSYLPLDTTWTASDGSEWSIPRIVEMEASEDIDSSPCGGSHRLVGLSAALNRHVEEGGEITGPWKLAATQINRALAKAHEYRQDDGSFSVNYFSRKASTRDVALQLNTTGHTLELLTYALDPEQLAEPWVTRAVLRLSTLLLQTRDIPLECGSLYHAAHALQVYRLRRFGERVYEDDATPPADASIERAVSR